MTARPALAACALMFLTGCSTIHRWFHPTPKPGCHEQPFTGNSDTRASLKVPEGLSAPDTTGAIKIPPLKQAEQARAHDAPCLDMPPAFGSEPTGLPARRPQP